MQRLAALLDAFIDAFLPFAWLVFKYAPFIFLVRLGFYLYAWKVTGTVDLEYIAGWAAKFWFAMLVLRWALPEAEEIHEQLKLFR